MPLPNKQTETTEETTSNTSEETTSNNSETSDKSEENNQDSSINDSDETLRAAQLFYDPKSVPDSLKPMYNRMQAAYTRKTQEIAGVRNKAKTLDDLVAHPEFQKWYRSMQGNKTDSSNTNSNSDTSDPNNFRAIIREEIANATKPLHEDREARRKKEADEFFANEKKALAEKFPQWESYKPAMSEVLSQYDNRITYEDAFKIAAFDDAAILGSKKSEADKQKLLGDKRRANGASKPTGNVKDILDKIPQPKTLREAAQLAIKGIDINNA